MEFIRPDEWEIKVWREDGTWCEDYREYFKDTKNNRDAIEKSVEALCKCFPSPECTVKRIEKKDMRGIEIKIRTLSINTITNQLASEFLYYSDFGNVTIKRLFGFLASSYLNFK